MFEVGKEYKTRDGSRARIYATDAGGSDSIHGAIFLSGSLECWVLAAWRESGKQFISLEDGHDLIPTPREVFGLFKKGSLFCTRNTLEEAEDFVRGVENFEIVKFVEATDAN